ncbi:phosphohistidine phosphatase SixA [Biformimicrobium ophioploci]|uniref:Phosphohistidine phosphatase SixA n=1 Tax=Biformimicrobium ophioploci TaxID=3036711 RepID=A0ABQ6LZE3_9GAMM|nr:phosphohistidine phosphatase SixA [Microbulbifer sp. NKW57]GMG87443.1 phosphohistidine phosphatase SixA [Microbulbifer sp. NKW57]
MRLLILRHGQAAAGAVDAERPLTELGKDEVRWMVGRRREDLAGVRTIWSSPYVRALESARIVADSLGLEVHEQPLLVPNARMPELVEALRAADIESLLLVSHQPLVGNLVDSLSGGNGALGTASLTCLESDIWAAGCCEQRWVEHVRLG